MKWNTMEFKTEWDKKYTINMKWNTTIKKSDIMWNRKLYIIKRKNTKYKEYVDWYTMKCKTKLDNLKWSIRENIMETWLACNGILVNGYETEKYKRWKGKWK